MIRPLICVVCLGTYLLVAGSVWANSASPFPVKVQQPAGQEITLYLRGTEKLHWYEYVPEAAQLTRASFKEVRSRELAKTPGFTVVQDAEGRYVYAALDEAGQWTPSDRVVGRDEPATEERRLMPPPVEMTRMALSRLPESGLPPRAAPPVGEVRNLVVLMRFSDHASRPLPSRENFEVLFNAPGGDPSLAPTGSVQDFYRENSYGKMTLRSTPTVWVTLPKSESYYANGKSGLDVRVREAMVDALNIVADKNLVDFTEFDNENNGAGDGWVDAITFVHSGYAAEFGGVAGGADAKDRIWSHRWVINTWTDPDSGVRVRDYNINPGLWGTSGSSIGRIGVICHELGHFFGLPDLYDYSGAGEGIGSWCLMANSWGFNGSQLNPPHMSAWCKLFLGWNQSQLIAAQATYKVPATASPEAKIYRINYSSGSPEEYLLIENRQPIGNFDGGIEAGTGGRGGLLVWHIDDAKTSNDTPGYPGQSGWPSNGNHYWVAVHQADGKYDLEKGNNRGDADDPYRAGHVDNTSPASVPTSSSYSGISGPTLQKISASAEVMTFQLGDGSDEPPPASTFTGNVNIEVPESHVSLFSEDGKAATILFDRLYAVSFGGDHVNTVSPSFVLPVKGDSAKAHLVLRGYVSADDGSAATMMIYFGGSAHAVDLEASRDESTNVDALHDETKENLADFRASSGIVEGFTWTAEFDAEVSTASAVTITPVLITEKRAKESGGAFLTIDSMEVELLTPSP